MKQLVGIRKEFYKAIAWEGLMDEDVRAWNTKKAEQKDQLEVHLEKVNYGTKSCN